MKRFLLLPLLLGALSTAPVQAQIKAMSLKGNVQSETNEPLDGADITVIHSPSGSRHVATSDVTGSFAVNNLMPGGPYLIRVGESGYRPQTVENIFLENGKAASFTVTLSKLTRTARKGRDAYEPSTPSRAAKAGDNNPELLASADPGAKPFVSVRAASGPGAGSSRPAITSDAPTSSASGSADNPSQTAYADLAAPARPSRYTPYRPKTARVPDAVVPGNYDAKTGNYVYDTGQPTKLKLAGGNVIDNVGVHSTESNLHRFLTDPTVHVDTVDLTRGWYNFDRVFFEAGKATLTAESLQQLRNVAALLLAYPRARVKLGGYTDATGTYQVNKQLSDGRAHTAWAALVEMGVSPGRIEARGYGPRYAIAPNTTEEGRAMNRRLSLKVLQK